MNWETDSWNLFIKKPWKKNSKRKKSLMNGKNFCLSYIKAKCLTKNILQTLYALEKL